MKSAVLFAVTLLCAAGAMPTLAQEPAATTTSVEEQQVLAACEVLATTANGTDAAALAALFTENGEIVDDTGTSYQSRTEIEALFARYLEQYPGVHVAITPDSIRLVTPGTAMVDGRKWVTSADRNVRVAQKFLAVLVASDEGWRFASFRESLDDQGLTPEERLMPLTWMLGDWVDENPASIVRMSCRWAEDKTALLRTFRVETSDGTVLDGEQRITWDPRRKQICAFTHDSAGGRSESFWTRDGDRWIAKTEAVRADGGTTSATFEFAPVDENRFSWKTRDRIVADELQPDVEVTVVRKPPTATADVTTEPEAEQPPADAPQN